MLAVDVAVSIAACPPHQLFCLQDLVAVLNHSARATKKSHQRGSREPALQIIVQTYDDVVAACGK